MQDGRTNSSATRRDGARPLLFISYRRRFDQASARLLKDELTRAGLDVFRDVDDIRAGDAFPETISRALEECDACLVLISPGWVELIEELRDPEDFVRREVSAALARRVSVIPVLLGDARMPEAAALPEEMRDLAFRQALALSDDRWNYDVERLVKLVRTRVALSESTSFSAKIAAASRRFFGAWPGKTTAAAVVVVAALVLAAAWLIPRALRYRRGRDLEGCVSLYAPDPFGGGARIRPGEADVPVVRADEYVRARQRPDAPEGVPLLLRLADSGKDVGVVFLRFHRADVPDESTFTIERIIAAPCTDVQDFDNDSRRAGDKHSLKSWDTLRVRLGGRDYYLRTGDHGDYVTATLMLTPIS